MQRRSFLQLAVGTGVLVLARTGRATEYVDMFDTYAQALYFDGSEGPTTGVIYVDYILANQTVDLDFWHGHGSQLHRFQVKPEHFAKLKAGERVYIETDVVESHSHLLFIDPVDPAYRVPGAEPVSVPLD